MFLEDAAEFLDNLESSSRNKIIYNVRKAQVSNDKRLFKKLIEDIWEFRTLYNQTQYSFFAFWDKTRKDETLVVTTHGIIKKTGKISKREIDKANQLRKDYFEQKQRL